MPDLSHCQQRDRGFALIVALGLMAFIFLLLVGVSALTRVETQRQVTDLHLMEARQNALLGLGLALAQLQKEAGPDRRATARADILGLKDDDAGDVIEAKRFWTGVWNPDSDDGPVWLVSRSSSSEQPTDTFAATSAWRVVVLGGGSASDHVEVELLPVAHDASESVATGRYGYWIGDEGVKAKVNIMEYLAQSADDLDGTLFQLLSAQRYAVENMEQMASLEAFVLPSGEGNGNGAALLSKLVHLGDLSLMDGAIAPEVLKDRYFDLTTFSFGVLSNSRDGGLKVDLTQKLKGPLLPPGDYLIDGDAARPNHQRIGPAWRLLQDYFQLADSISGLSPEVDPRFEHAVSPSGQPLWGSLYGEHAWAQNITPVPVFSGLTYGLFMLPEGENTFRLHLMIKPVVALWNPYDVALSSAGYTVEFSAEGDPRTIHARTPAVVVANRSSDPLNWVVHINELLPGYVGNNSNSSQVNNLHFHVQSGTLAPGQIQWYSLPAELADAYTGGLALEPGFRPGSFVYAPIHSRAGFRREERWARDRGIDIGLVQEADIASPSAFGLGPNIGRYGVRWHWGTPAFDALSENTLFHYTRVTGRSGGPYTMRIAQSGSGEDAVINDFPDVVSTGVVLYGPHRSDKFLGARTPENSGLKAISNYNVRSRHHSTFEDKFDGLAWKTDAPLYGQIYTHGGMLAFDDEYLWAWDAMTVAGYRVVLFHLPRERLFSIGQLQHLDVSRSSWEPSYVIGNSFASPWIEAGAIESAWDAWTLYDTSWYLNDVMWDRYFFSTVDLLENGEGLLEPRNKRLQPSRVPADLSDDLERAMSANLIVNGPFNINSTSVEAWKAFLSGLNSISIDYRDTATGERVTVDALQNPFSRSPNPAGSSDDYWRGFRELTDEQLTHLSGQIVHQIRERGPFMTVGQFVNRTVQASRQDLALYGALQAAIDSGEAVVVDGVVYNPPAINPPGGGPDSVNILPSELGYKFAEAARGPRSQAATGYLTQADILSVLGATITARSDTFVIRAYGDVVSPLEANTNSPAPLARAWCEAIVQRTADEIDSIEDEFGRRFRVISFRWLLNDEV